jgi:hypothetical protein
MRTFGFTLLLVSSSFASLACNSDHEPKPPGEPVCTSCGECEEELSIESAFHVDEPVDYADYPPAGGDHFVCWAVWGAHQRAVVTERWVHNLEHGGVVFLYGCDPEEDEECKQARTFFDAFAQEHAFGFSTPKEADKAMKTRFAALAWGYRLETDCFDEAAFRAFFDAHVNRAPESFATDPSPSCG